MSHFNVALAPHPRLKVARLVVNDGWTISEVAGRFQVSWPTVKRWVDRYRAGGPMNNRSSRPTLHEQRQTLAQTTQALNAISSAVGGQLHASVPMSIGELAHLLGVRTSALRVWENAGLPTPQRLPGA